MTSKATETAPKILVTGATGNVGHHLVPLLHSRGINIRVLVRDKRKTASFPDAIEIVEGDLDKADTLTPAMDGVKTVFLVSPWTEQVQRVIDSAKKAGVQRIVKQSTIEADRSIGPGKWHREQEDLIRASGLSWTFCRPSMMMTNTIQWWSSTVKKQGRVYFPGGRGRVPAIDPRDIAAATCSVLTETGHEGKVYEFTGPESLTIAEMVTTLGRIVGEPIRYVDVPPFMAALWLRRFGLSKRLVKGLMDTLRALRRNEYANVSDAVRKLTGISPRRWEDWCCENASLFRKAR